MCIQDRGSPVDAGPAQPLRSPAGLLQALPTQGVEMGRADQRGPPAGLPLGRASGSSGEMRLWLKGVGMGEPGRPVLEGAETRGAGETPGLAEFSANGRTAGRTTQMSESCRTL